MGEETTERKYKRNKGYRNCKRVFEESKGRYGYRRICLQLRKEGIIMNHKKVLIIMKENNLLCNKYGLRRKSYSSYNEQVGKIAKNNLNRDFHVEKANTIWVSDVTEFRIKNSEIKLYLSPIMYLYNREIISYSLSKSPTVEFTLKSLKDAIQSLPAKHNLMIHTDQGFHYQHRSWVHTLEKHGIKQSMSRKGNCLDNSPMENFFGLLKQEMFYCEDYKAIEELEVAIREYIDWYNNKRIKTKLNGLSPVEYRLQAV